MKNKKPKGTKVGNKRKKVPSDISPSTSLPPLVEGQVRCFLRVTVGRVLWTIPKPPAVPLVRLRWWGESSSGTHFRPRDGSTTDQRGAKTTVRFAIRCGPKQFTSYLTDMGVLVLDVLTNPDHLPFGRVQVSGIARLSLSQSISGFFTLVSPTSEKLGELQVSLNLEPLLEAYDSCSSVHTTDASVDTALSVPAPLSKAPPHQEVLVVPALSRPLTTNGGRESVASSTANTPRGKDHLYFQETINGQVGSSSAAPRTVAFPGNGHPVSQYEEEEMKNRDQVSRQESANGQNSKDILSVLLDRGSKLRNAMVVSALKSNLDSDLTLKDIPLPVSKDNIITPPLLQPRPSSGKLLENLLHSEPSVFPSSGGLHSPKHPNTDLFADAENRAVELLMGSVDGSSLWDRDSSPLEFLSGGSSVLADSELNDPLHDESLLETLFYKSAKPDGSQSDFTADEDDGLPMKKKQRKTHATGKHEDEQEPRCSGMMKSGSLSLRDSKRTPEERSTLADLSADRIAALGRIHLARVLIHSLTVPADSTPATPHKALGKGKPPRPHPPRKCSYFVEYSFPVAPSRHDAKQVAVGSEVTRVASCKVSGGVVKFQQRTVFPVQFSEAAIKHWWGTDLTFKIYSRERFQKKPVAYGRAVFPLLSLLSSEQLSQAKALPVLSLEGGREEEEVGKLKVSLELGAVSKDFSPAKARGSSQSGTEPSNAAPNPPRTATPTDDIISTQPPRWDRDREEPPVGGIEWEGGRPASAAPAPAGGIEREGGTPASAAWGVQDSEVVRRPPPSHPPAPLSSPGRRQPQRPAETEGGALLHTLLLVPDGREFTCSPTPPNVYLNCKMFGSDETTRSAVSWGHSHPTFNFSQVAPVVLSPRLLERMRNNVMVIEVWQKGGLGQDQLLGLVKMPLQQFYMSFRDPKISQLLLGVQYPVVAVDSYMPVIDVFSGSTRGSLRVLLAMGLAEQIVSLQRMRDEDHVSVPHPPRPAHTLDQRQQVEPKVSEPQEETTMEHVFEMTVERVKGLTPLQSTVWGEADCYVQYSFPTQEEDPTGALDSHTIESSVCLRQFRTGTALCVPDPVFSHSQSHALLAPAGVPVQRLLLSSCSSQGPSARGGIPFQVWCRYYYPNVRDQLVAKGLLPLSKLCAMVTMQTHEQTGPQVFSLPLLPQTEILAGHHPQPSGLLDVCVRYKPQPMRAHGLKDGAVASRVIALAVQVHRATGLQAAARMLARRDESLRYHADVGVNAYVTAQLSFLPERERRSTRVVARSFCPEFDHHTEFPCNLLVQSGGGGSRSLAELLEGANAVFTVCHRSSRKGTDSTASKDTVLGTVAIQLGDLIHKRTGISGWFPVSLSQDPGSPGAPPALAGGLEVSVGFAHHADRERVISAARGLGWETGGEEKEEEEDEEEESGGTVTLSLATPRLWLPLHCLLLPGHRALERSTYCYLRYRLYEEPAYCSPLRHPSAGEDRGVATVAFGDPRAVELRRSLPLRWYLREERLELQVWVAFGKDRRARPHDTDRLVGSAYVDLSPLARRTRSKLSVSGVYPLFRRSSPDLDGAALRVHITLTPTRDTALSEPPLPRSDSEDERGRPGALYSAEEEEEEEEEEGPPPQVAAASRQSGSHSRHRTKWTVSPEALPSQDASAEDTFAVTVTVDRAMHLSLKGSPLAERSGGMPSCCVSFATADAETPVTTPVVPDNSCPVWDHQWVGRLSQEVLVDPQQTMVFKVWHKGDMERVIGFASVDLSPLLSGFQSVCGWYNITDFNGQCQGQLKVAVSPMKGVRNLRGQRQAAHEDGAKDPTSLFQNLPMCYHTSAMYTRFPAHLARYPEQKINTSPEQVEALLSGRSSVSDRLEEHVRNVRVFHQSLQNGERAPHSAAPADLPPSSSTLFSALRKNLSELDDIQRYFSRKLTTPTFPSLPEQAPPPRPDEHRDSETDSAQLLLRSSRLVGEVNSLIGDLHGHHHSGPRENSQGISGLANTLEHHLLSNWNRFSAVKQTEAQHGPSEGLETPEDRGPPSCSPVPQGRDEPSDVQGGAEEVRREHGSLSSDEGERWCGDLEEDEGEEEREYEETVIEPRTLNEVTVATDRTSPWTSLLSEPDLGSLQSLEDLEEQPGPSQEAEGRGGGAEEVEISRGGVQQAEPLYDRSCEELLGVTPEEDPHTDHTLSDESDPDEARVRHLGPRTSAAPPQDLSPGDEEAPNEGEDSEEERDTASPAPQNLWEERDSRPSEKENSSAEDKESKRPDPVDIPNFFLSAQHLEASMRAMRLAPVFPRPLTDTGKKSGQQGISLTKAPRPRPSIPPPSAMNREEARRIAKIFSSRFTEEK
ncbi:C2 domain-containing protein 3 [Conger conger]|uniref:C2 domain-containing protein 3 n=1 Tax=Conger conger TaxID=82655 RepID=UPI002A5A1148|nr:C2 domain-containing protein 3 [Conger conger]